MAKVTPKRYVLKRVRIKQIFLRKFMKTTTNI